MRHGQRTFRSRNKEDRHTCYTGTAKWANQICDAVNNTVCATVMHGLRQNLNIPVQKIQDHHCTCVRPKYWCTATATQVVDMGCRNIRRLSRSCDRLWWSEDRLWNHQHAKTIHLLKIKPKQNTTINHNRKMHTRPIKLIIIFIHQTW